MKKLGMILVAALAFSVSVFAEDVKDNSTSAGWDGTINKAKLTKYLNLNSVQHEKVADICDFFKEEMAVANRSKSNKNQKVRNAVYANLKLMKQTLDAKQYSSYVRLMAMTLNNKGIKLEESK